MLGGPLHGGLDLLVGHGAQVDHVRRALEALALHRVEKLTVCLLDHGQHRLATRRAPAAEDRRDALLLDQTTRFASEYGRIGAPVGHHRLDGVPEQPAGSVDVLDGDQGGLEDGPLTDGERSSLRMEHAYLDGSFGNGVVRVWQAKPELCQHDHGREQTRDGQDLHVRRARTQQAPHHVALPPPGSWSASGAAQASLRTRLAARLRE